MILQIGKFELELIKLFLSLFINSYFRCRHSGWMFWRIIGRTITRLCDFSTWLLGQIVPLYLSNSLIQLLDEILCQWTSLYKVILNLFMQIYLTFEVHQVFLKFLIFLQQVLDFLGLKLNLISILLILYHDCPLLSLIGEST